METTQVDNVIYDNLAEIFPFYNVNQKEFNYLFNISTKSLEHNMDLYNLLPNPDKADEIDSDLMLTNITSKYHTIDKINKDIDKSHPKQFLYFTVI